jgi:hypothetical protein
VYGGGCWTEDGNVRAVVGDGTARGGGVERNAGALMVLNSDGVTRRSAGADPSRWASTGGSKAEGDTMKAVAAASEEKDNGAGTVGWDAAAPDRADTATTVVAEDIG